MITVVRNTAPCWLEDDAAVDQKRAYIEFKSLQMTGLKRSA